eukprot:gene986-biopygen7042
MRISCVSAGAGWAVLSSVTINLQIHPRGPAAPWAILLAVVALPAMLPALPAMLPALPVMLPDCSRFAARLRALGFARLAAPLAPAVRAFSAALGSVL